MRPTNVCVALLLSLSLPAVARAQSATPLRDAVRTFIETKLLKHSLVSSSESLIANGTIRSKFSNSFVYSDLTSSERGLTYKLVSSTHQTLQDLVGGQPSGPARTADRAGVSNCEFREHPWSSTKLFGFCSNGANTYMDSTGSLSPATIELRGEALVYETYGRTMPSDCFATGDTTTPCEFHMTETYEIVGGKVRLTGHYVTSAIDAETFAPGAVTTEETRVTWEP